MATDLVVIPLLPSPLDVWAAAETVDLVRGAQVYNEHLKCCLAVNRKIVNTAIGRDVRNALKELDVPILKPDVGQRVAVAESLAGGTTVLDHGDAKGKSEIKRFINELRRLFILDDTTSIEGSLDVRIAQTRSTIEGRK